MYQIVLFFWSCDKCLFFPYNIRTRHIFCLVTTLEKMQSVYSFVLKNHSLTGDRCEDSASHHFTGSTIAHLFSNQLMHDNASSHVTCSRNGNGYSRKYSGGHKLSLCTCRKDTAGKCHVFSLHLMSILLPMTAGHLAGLPSILTLICHSIKVCLLSENGYI